MSVDDGRPDGGDVPVTWKVRMAARTSTTNDHEIRERDLGDVVIEIGPWARVGDLVVELASSLDLGLAPGDIGWAGLELADGEIAAADERLSPLSVAHGDRVVVVIGVGSDDPAPAAAFSATSVPSVRYGLVTLGADADLAGGGDVVELEPGLVPIGRSASDNVVVVDDPSVSRRHATLLVGSDVVVSDLDSTNGTCVDGVVVSGDRRVPVGSRLDLGDVAFELRALARSLVDPAPSRKRAPNVRPAPRHGSIAFNREPSVPEPLEVVTIALPEPPGSPEEHRMPWLSVAIPLALAAVMVAVPLLVGGLDGSYVLLSAGFLLMSPIMVVASFWETRRVARRRRRDRFAQFDGRVAAAERRGRAAVEVERRRREVEHPGVEARWRQSQLAEPGLWAGAERLGGEVRIGSGRVATMVRCRRDVGDDSWIDEPPPIDLDPEACAELARVAAGVRHHEAAPVTIPAVGVVAIVGEDEWATGVARWLVLQLATALPPASLVLSVSTDDSRASAFEWVKWLPHQVVVGAAETLGDEVGVRLVVVDAFGDGDLLDLAERAGAVAQQGAFVIWVGRRRGDIPSTTRTIVEEVVAGAPSAGWSVADVVDLTTGAVERAVAVDRVSDARADEWARDLAPLCDSAGMTGSGRLPAAVAIGDVLTDRRLMFDPNRVAAAWGRAGMSLVASIGRTVGGIAAIDLRRDGPHAVIAGTTGAGKSELLQTMVVSLAMSHPPSRVNFLLVDYKGGAAFAECAALPHTVGLVTDLDGMLVRRVLTSLRAEVRRREAILASAGAKDLVTLEERDPAAAPPSLVIVVDEFASLTTEVPGFVEGMIDLARRGRSLGLHLVLATQRPAGVVSDQLLANANLRIALRVADPHESTDLVGVPDAAALARSCPGRAVARLGPGDLLHLQTAFCGGRTPPPDPRDRSRDVSVRPFSIGTAPVSTDLSAADLELPTDLRRLVDSATGAARASGEHPPRRPWLDPLPKRVALDPSLLAEPGERLIATLGLADDPDRQSQFMMRYDLGCGPLAVYGAGDGPARFVSAVLAGLVDGRSPRELQVDVIDGEAGGFRSLAALPHVGSVIEPSDTDRVGRLLRHLRSSVGRPAGHGPTRILVVNDVVGFAAQSERLDGGATVESLVRIATDGPEVGVHVITVTGRRVGVPSGPVATAGRRVVMAMGSGDELATLGVDADLLGAECGGRAVIDGLAVQTVELAGTGAWSLGELAARAVARWGAVRAPAVGVLPDVIEASSVAPAKLHERRAGGTMLVGVDDHDLEPVEVDLARGNLLIAGPLRSGRSTALGSLAASLAASGHAGPVRPILVAPRSTEWSRSPIWSDVGIGDRALPLLRWARESASPASGDVATVIFVDDSTDLDDEVDEELARLTALTRETDLRIVAAAESVMARRAYGGVVAELRRERRALLLQPDIDLDGDLAGVRLPRRSPRPAPPGRGELVEHGHASLVQVAIASHALPAT